MIKQIMIIDTETLGLAPRNIAYNIGWIIAEVDFSSGELVKIVEERSILVEEVFADLRVMNTAYFRDKYIGYLYELQGGASEICSRQKALEVLQHDIEYYKIKEVFAYNADFDRQVIEKMFYDAGELEIYQEFSKKLNLNFHCIWNMACQEVFDEKYIEVAHREKWWTDSNNVKTSAETATRYLRSDYNFIEEHRALQDVRIELEILLYCLKVNPEVETIISPCPWKRVFSLDKAFILKTLNKREEEYSGIQREIHELHQKVKALEKTLPQRMATIEKLQKRYNGD